jgi:hypothetical protein
VDRFRRQLKKFAWVALLAFVGLAVAPTISRAIHLGDGAQLLAAGGNLHPAGMGSTAAHHHHGAGHPDGSTAPPSPAGHQHSLDHCAMCLVAACAFALGVAPPVLAVQTIGDEQVITPTSAAPRFSDDWSPATSRGPPSSA